MLAEGLRHPFDFRRQVVPPGREQPPPLEMRIGEAPNFLGGANGQSGFHLDATCRFGGRGDLLPDLAMLGLG